MPAKRRYFWVVVDDDDVDVDVCLTDPGFAVDVVVVADLRTLTEVWMAMHASSTPWPMGASQCAAHVN